MSSDLFRSLWEWWNALEPGFKFLMVLPFAIPGLAVLGETWRYAWARLRNGLPAQIGAAPSTAARANRAR